MRLFAAASAMVLPTAVEPVNAIFAMRFELARWDPASFPKPLTTFRTPGGRMDPIISSSTMIDTGVVSAGFRTTALPAAAGARGAAGGLE